MSEHQITLPEKVYYTLLTLAHQQGITPADWIAAQFPLSVPEEQSLPENVTDLIGAIDSQTDPQSLLQRTPFGEGIAAKLARQGIQRP